jgi:exopolysaccharide biosynthesis protein
MVVDGRNTGVSEGVILTDLARLMTGVGCVDVMNLDGGGSSVFCVGSDMTVLNRPTDGTERAVVSAVGFAKK